MDVFLENSQTAFDPPPSFLEITLRFFPENPLSMRKFAMKFFGLAMTPPGPPLPLFLEITLRFFPENLLSMRKFAMKFFGLGMTPPSPPFWTFFPKFTTKIYRFETNKICNVIFLDRK